MRPYAAVAVEAPVTEVYTYRVPEALEERIRPGARVVVPFGNRTLRGFCVERTDHSPVADEKLRDILRAGDEGGLLTPELLRLTRWVADYYRSGWGQVLAAAVPGGVRRGQGARSERRVRLVGTRETIALALEGLRRAPRQRALLEALRDSAPEPLSAKGLLRATGAAAASLKALERKGLVAFEVDDGIPPPEARAEDGGGIVLTEEQNRACLRLVSALESRRFEPFLLYGVTGSGKTEVYLRAMEHALGQNRGVLVLVPEISLTPQTVQRFRARAEHVAVLHSHMAEGERAEAWRALRRGEVRTVVGARSAVFAPVRDLGLVIVDEEHERSFKQEKDPRYNARDVAVKRAQEEGAAVILGSATPSLESWRNADEGRYERLTLSGRVGGARQPEAAVVDMRRERAEAGREVVLSRELARALQDCLSRREQAILLLNRRGFHTWCQCRAQDCGHVLRCDDCDIAYTYHRRANRLRCHYCDAAAPVPTNCPLCGGSELRFAGAGTERIETVLSEVIPAARVLRMDSDTMTRRGAHATALGAFARGEYDILLGTQMVAKGLDFPNVTLVGVLSADGALNLPDFRAAERTFQLIAQVVGRAGRATKPGRGVIQAYEPDHAAVRAAVGQDFPSFAENELRERDAHGYPPAGHLARIIARGRREPAVRELMQGLGDAFRRASPRIGACLGPVPCPIERIQGEVRWHILLKAADRRELRALLQAGAPEAAAREGVRIAVDIDPISLL